MFRPPEPTEGRAAFALMDSPQSETVLLSFPAFPTNQMGIPETDQWRFGRPTLHAGFIAYKSTLQQLI